MASKHATTSSAWGMATEAWDEARRFAGPLRATPAGQVIAEQLMARIAVAIRRELAAAGQTRASASVPAAPVSASAWSRNSGR